MNQAQYDELTSAMVGKRVEVRRTFVTFGGPATVVGHRWRAENPYGGGPGSYPVFEVEYDDGHREGGLALDLLNRIRRRTMIENVHPGQSLQQVRYWDPLVQVWCDFGDPVSLDQVNAKAQRCREGFTP